MKILVTGANGMLGQDLCPILEDNGYDVLETDKHNLDITNPNMCMEFVQKEAPEIIIHCAAYTDVDGAEGDLQTAIKINVEGTKNIANACKNVGSTLIYISTDYVFDGNKSKPYEVSDKPAPLNNYGLTKLEGENFVKKHCLNHYIIRTSWLYGHYGKNFVETMLSLKDKENLRVVDDQIGCPTWTVDLANGIVKIFENYDFGTYHVCGSGETSWYEFAKEIFEQEGLVTSLLPCSTEEFPRPAKRPRYSVMDNNKICRHWKLALKDYLALRLEEEF